MATINEQVLDKLIGHEIDLSRLGNGQVREIVSILNSGDSKIQEELIKALSEIGDDYSQEAVSKALESAAKENKSVFEKVRDALAALIIGVIGYEVAYQRGLLITIIPGAVQEKHPIAEVDEKPIVDLVKEQPFQGRQFDQWVDGLQQSRIDSIGATIRNGIVGGLTAAAIIKTIMGTKAEKNADGDLNKFRVQLEAVVVSAVAVAAMASKEAVTTANKALISHVEWVSVLDNRTTTTCIIRSGKAYTIGSHAPIGHKIPWLAGPGKIHFRCRSSYVIVFKSAAQLGIDDDSLGAIMNGISPKHTTYAEWLYNQTAEKQDEVLGPTRGRMLREGKLKVSAFFNDKGIFLTLDQLREKLNS